MARGDTTAAVKQANVALTVYGKAQALDPQRREKAKTILREATQLDAHAKGT